MNSIEPKDILFTGRGSTGIYSLLKELNFTEKGVLLPINVCEIVVATVLSAGYRPVYYDVDEISGNSDFETIHATWTSQERVLILVHNFGTPVRVLEIERWCKQNQIFLIEDICNSLGATINGRAVGTFGDAAVLSFGYAKIIEHGYGGGLLIKDSLLKTKIQKRVIRSPLYSEIYAEKDHHFQNRIKNLRRKENEDSSAYTLLYQEYLKYIHYRISPDDEKIIRSRFKSLDQLLNKRAEIADFYRREIQNPLIQHREKVDGEIIWRYTLHIKPDRRRKLVDSLLAHNIPISLWYPPIGHLFDGSINNEKFPGAVKFGESVFNLWVDKIESKQVEQAVRLINLVE